MLLTHSIVIRHHSPVPSVYRYTGPTSMQPEIALPIPPRKSPPGQTDRRVPQLRLLLSAVSSLSDCRFPTPRPEGNSFPAWKYEGISVSGVIPLNRIVTIQFSGPHRKDREENPDCLNGHHRKDNFQSCRHSGNCPSLRRM